MSWAIVFFLEGNFEKAFDVLENIFLKISEPIAFLKYTLTYHNKAKYFLTSLALVGNGESQTFSIFKIKK